MPILPIFGGLFRLLARFVAVLYRLAYYLVREFFGLLTALLGLALFARCLFDVVTWRVDQDTLVAFALGLAFIGLGLLHQMRR